ncbi:MAG: autotransporter-associated beta strand repeat-containing protein, partial [Chthoniobacteraceae bacterium]|nr:autotransporter-associated beta strand repeat-containing protein [Chthoniobacteraceae bacterium]
PGYLKLDPNSATGADVNFIEFYWSDFLRQRVVWNDNAAVTSPNLINAPVSFFAAVANGNALAKSELYVDQFGRSLTDYTSSIYSANTQNWANATLKNGLAVAGDTYNLFLTDDSTIQGSILASAVDGVVSNLNINTGTGMTVAGALQNFTSISINTGGSITIDWKDSSVNALTQNKTLTVASGSANVIFSGDNDYSKLSSLVVGAGTLNLNTANQTVDQTIWADISGSGSIRKTGAEQLTLTGANTFSGGLSLDEGKLVLGSPSVTVNGVLISSAAGKGPVSVKAGATLGFDESVLLPNAIRINAGSVSDALTTVYLGDNAVEFSGTVSAAVPLT